MELSRMAIGIIKMIDKKFPECVNEEYLDLIQIKNICNLYKNKTLDQNSITLSEINLSSPQFKKTKTNSKEFELLKTEEFKKKYAFFIRIIYSCLKMDVDIFDINNVVTLKNNYHLLKAIENCKKKFIRSHMEILKEQYRNIDKKIDEDYHNFFQDYMVKIKILDKIICSINKLISTGIFEKMDNIFSLILPYFYKYTEYIEEYN